jgi:hypothetical protein
MHWKNVVQLATAFVGANQWAFMWQVNFGLWRENGSKRSRPGKNLIPCELLVHAFNGIAIVFAASET